MIYLGVVNDLADDEEPALFENFARGVSEVDRALDPVTKAELLGEANRGLAYFNDPSGAMYFIDDVAAIMLLDLLLHRRHHVRRPQVYFLARRRSAGDEIGCAHNIQRLICRRNATRATCRLVVERRRRKPLCAGLDPAFANRPPVALSDRSS